MAGVPVLLAEPVHQRPRGGLVLDPGERAEEAGALDLDLRLAVAGDRQVAVYSHSPNTSPPIRTMKAETTTMKKIRTNREPRATAVRAPT